MRSCKKYISIACGREKLPQPAAQACRQLPRQGAKKAAQPTCLPDEGGGSSNGRDGRSYKTLVFAKNKESARPAIVARPPTTPDIVYAQTFQSTPLLTIGYKPIVI